MVIDCGKFPTMYRGVKLSVSEEPTSMSVRIYMARGSKTNVATVNRYGPVTREFLDIVKDKVDEWVDSLELPQPVLATSISVQKITGSDLMRECLSFAYGIDSKMDLDLAYERGHTPIRTQLFLIKMRGIKTKASVHLVRHSGVGQFHLVGSNRGDWKKVEDVDEHDKRINRCTPVNHVMLLNAQHLIEMAHARLCNKAEEYTRGVMEEIRHQVARVDYPLALKMVPRCYYRNGLCSEPNPCGLYKQVGKRPYKEP